MPQRWNSIRTNTTLRFKVFTYFSSSSRLTLSFCRSWCLGYTVPVLTVLRCAVSLHSPSTICVFQLPFPAKPIVPFSGLT